MNLRVGVVAVMLTASGAAGVSGFDCTRTVSRVTGGSTESVVVIGDVAVLGFGATLLVADLADPARPAAMAELSFGVPGPDIWGLSGMTGDPWVAVHPVAAWDGHAIVVVDVHKLYGARVATSLAVGDLAEPSAPVVVGWLEGGPREGTFETPPPAVVVGDIAWVASRSLAGSGHRLVAVDLGDPSNPLPRGHHDTTSRIVDLAAAGELVAVLEDRPRRLTLLDVARPESPVVRSTFDGGDAGDWLEVALGAGHAYVVGRSSVLALDVSDPAAPVVVGAVDYGRQAFPRALEVIGQELYVGFQEFHPSIGGDDGGLEVFDLSDPATPSHRHSRDFSPGAVALASGGGWLAAADLGRGLRVFMLDEDVGPSQVGLLNPTFDEVLAVVVDGNLAIVGDQGVRVLDLGAEVGVPELGALELDGMVSSLAVGPGPIAAVSLRDRTWPHGVSLVAVDLAEPSQPVELGRLGLLGSSPWAGWPVALSGSLAALTAGSEGLLLVDLTDPSQPVERARVATAHPAVTVNLAGDLAVVGTGRSRGGCWQDPSGLEIVDVSDPDHPVTLAGHALPYPAAAVALDGARAVVVTCMSLHILDLSEPSAPVELGAHVDLFYRAKGVALEGDLAFVSSSPGGLAVFDLTRPERPRRVARTLWGPWWYDDPRGGQGVALHDGRAVIADGRFGLRILDVGRCLARMEVPAAPAAE